jgi:hypothetical protein
LVHWRIVTDSESDEEGKFQLELELEQNWS